MNLAKQPDATGCTARLLLACARRELDAGHIHAIEATWKLEADWESLWARACKHGVAYFLAQHLRQLRDREPARFSLPQEFADKMRDEQRTFALQALRFLHHQLELSEAFEAQSIPVLWLKGLGLSQQLYGRPEARCCSDLDLYVRRAERPGVEECLRRRGFEPLRSPIPGKDEHPLGLHHDTWIIHQGGEVVVEVHYRLSGPEVCQPDVEGVIGRARWLELSGQQVRVPALEDELLMLCLHAHQHNFAMLRTLMDVAEYVKTYGQQLDWTVVLERAAASRARGRVLGALAVAQRTLGFEAIGALEDGPRLGPLQRSVLNRLSPETIAQCTGDQNDARRVRLTLLMDRWSDVARLILPHFLPPTPYVRAICPSPWRNVPGIPRLYHLARLTWRALGG